MSLVSITALDNLLLSTIGDFRNVLPYRVLKTACYNQMVSMPFPLKNFILMPNYCTVVICEILTLRGMMVHIYPQIMQFVRSLNMLKDMMSHNI